jgi:carbonic anhydrase
MFDMDTLIKNFHKFRKHHFTDHPGLYDQLLHQGQKPKALVISCCDSRVDPALLFDAKPGELFVVRNIANWVPEYEQLTDPCSVSAALSFGVCNLNIPNIIILGHSHCAGVKTLSQDVDIATPVTEWTGLFDYESKKEHTMVQSVLAQSWSNLFTYPWIKSRVSSGTLNIHGWVFCINTGILESYNLETTKFDEIA